VSLNVEACRLALADAGVDKSVVDAVFVKVPTSSREFMYGQKVSEALGIAPRIGGAWDQGGAANLTLLSFAIMAIEAGQCEVALVCYADNPRSGNRAVYGRPRGDDAAYGWFSTAAGYAMIHRRLAIEHGTRPEHFAAVAMASRRHGAENPNAQLRKPLTLEQYMASPWVVGPDPPRRFGAGVRRRRRARGDEREACTRARVAAPCRCSASATGRPRSRWRSAPR
jgi:acetyl-CoA acetyltransferase